jgi:tetratricopeptide (TPR) repeat protein
MTKQSKSVADDKIAISIFNPERSTKDLSSENGDFLHLQVLLEVFVRMRIDDVRSSLDEFLDLARKQYQGNSDRLAEIDNLKAKYSPKEAVWWYSRESPPLYQMLNKALRQQNIEILFTFRFLIRDLNRQLTELKQEQFKNGELLQLYRGQIMSTKEFNQLNEGIDHIISMNSFLSTSANREQACQFMLNKKIDDGSQVRVLFEMVADTNRADTRPFAKISEFSEFPNEEEVLFMAGSVFRLDNIRDEQNKGVTVHVIKLNLCGDNDNQLRDVLTSMKDEIGQETNLLSLGNILQDLGKLDQAAHFYRCLSAQLPADSFNVAVCHYSLGSIAHIQGDCDEALRNYQYLLRQLPRSDQLVQYQPHFVGLVYNAMGAAYERKNELNNAVKYYQQALDLLDQNSKLEAAAAFANLGNVYRKQNKFDLALANQQTCLQVNRSTYVPF